MDENKNQKSNHFKDINDDQERLFFQFSSIWDKRLISSSEIITQLHELKLLQVILYILIISGIITFSILVLVRIHLIIIIINFGVIILYIAYSQYIKYALRKSLKITKKELKLSIKLKKEVKNISRLQILFYSILILTMISILFISMIGIDPLTLIIIISLSLIIIHFDKDVKEKNTVNV